MIEFPSSHSASAAADWIELELLCHGGFISKTKFASLAELAWGRECDESYLVDVWTQLERRQRLLASPFVELSGNLAQPTGTPPPNATELKAMLFFSLFGSASQSGANPKLFERLSGEALANHLGGSHFVFGWPVSNGAETDIGRRVRQVADMLGERFIENPNARYKDRGLDIVAWKPFCESTRPGRRSGQLVVLSQCASGHDWRNKTSELPMGSWMEYIHWASDPVPAFTVPSVIDVDLWHDVHREVRGLVLDRIRLANSLPNGVSDQGLTDELTDWVRAMTCDYTT